MTGLWMSLALLVVIFFLFRDEKKQAANAAINRMSLEATERRLGQVLKDAKRATQADDLVLGDRPPDRWVRPAKDP